MRTTTAVSARPLLRAALLGSGLAAAWVVVTLAAGPSSAHAEEDPSGLLGTVGSVVGVVDDTVGTVTDDVIEPVVATAVDPVAEAVEAVTPVAPAPVAPVVEAVPAVVDTATDAAGATVESVDAVATDVVADVGGAVGDLAGSAPVGGLADPLVDVVDDVVGGLPVLGPVLGDDTLGGLLGPVVGVVDDTLGAVVGELGPLPGDGLVPSLPDLGLTPKTPDGQGPGTPGDPIELGATRSGAVAASAEDLMRLVDRNSGAAGAAAVVGAVEPASGPPGGDERAPFGTNAPTGSSSGASGSGGSAGSDAALAAHDLDALASLVLHAVDDALPSSPVFDTDTTPD